MNKKKIIIFKLNLMNVGNNKLKKYKMKTK